MIPDGRFHECIIVLTKFHKTNYHTILFTVMQIDMTNAEFQ